MASLTHVCVWSKNGWKRITPEEVAREHSRGGVSARSGIFMCSLCGQFAVSFGEWHGFLCCVLWHFPAHHRPVINHQITARPL